MYLNTQTILDLCKGKNPNIILVNGFVKAVNERAESFGIDTPQRLAFFIGQCLHETGWFQNFGEAGYIKNPAEKMAKLKAKKYYPYYGRGPIQLTGNKLPYGKNYEVASKKIWGDLRGVQNPDLFLDPYFGTLGSMSWWQNNNASKAADTGNPTAVSKKVNINDTVTFGKRAALTTDTVSAFKNQVIQVQWAGARAKVKHSLWDYLSILSKLKK